MKDIVPTPKMPERWPSKKEFQIMAGIYKRNEIPAEKLRIWVDEADIFEPKQKKTNYWYYAFIFLLGMYSMQMYLDIRIAKEHFMLKKSEWDCGLQDVRPSRHDKCTTYEMKESVK